MKTEIDGNDSLGNEAAQTESRKRLQIRQVELKRSPDGSRLNLANKTIVVDGTSDADSWQPCLELELDALNSNLCGIKAYKLVLNGNYRQFRITDSPTVKSLTLAKGRYEGLDLSRLAINYLHINLDETEFGWIQLPPNLKRATFYSQVISMFHGHREADLVNFKVSDLEATLEVWTNPTRRSQVIDWLLHSARPRVSQARQTLIRGSSNCSVFGVLKQKTMTTRPRLLMASLLVARPNFQNMMARLEQVKEPQSPTRGDLVISPMRTDSSF